jgi:hypothetical protein
MTQEFENSKTTALCKRLASATLARAAEWRLEGEDTYVWAQQQGTVSIASRDNDGQPPYQLAIYNAERVRVDELSSMLLQDDEPAPWNEALAELYRVARRSALRADDVIDALLSALPSHANAASAEAGSARG